VTVARIEHCHVVVGGAVEREVRFVGGVAGLRTVVVIDPR